MIKDILNEIKKSSFSVLPIYLLVLFLCLIKIISLTGFEILSFSLATILVILGISLFNYGADRAMTPIGKMVGKGLTKQGKVWILLIVVLLFGFFITIAEPDLAVLASQTKSVFSKPLLIISVGISVGVFLVLAILKIIKKINLIRILSVLYLVGFSLLCLLVNDGKENMVALCFDSGGVTTGPMTVPFLMALGAGVASVLAQKSEKDASFGFIAFSSIGPVIMLLILSLTTNKTIEYSQVNYEVSNNFFISYMEAVWEKIKEVGLSIGLLFICYFVIDLIFLHSDKKKILKMVYGLLFAYFGLVLFLAAVDSIYIGVGFKIGKELSDSKTIVVVLIAFVIGALTVLAEPAIKILISQVEEMTNGLVKRRNLLIALAIGVGLAISLALTRIIFKFTILYIIIPGYVLCFILSFFIPKIYTAIAFDAGGVASGPLTSSFILPLALGLCAGFEYSANEILSFGFGIVSLVALSPLLSIEILGVISVFNNNRRKAKEIKKVLKEEDKIIISFGD
ncbi:MAG: DUF1538 domain-containing protein [Acholeplasmatales bacterium]|nr:DUF1538 domain-containing protein [Acholeplasmatales bacterium]